MANIIDKFMDFMKLGYDEYDNPEEEEEDELYEESTGGLFKKPAKNPVEKDTKVKTAKKEVKTAKEPAAKPEKQTAGFGNKVSVVKGGKDAMSQEIFSIRPVDDSAKKEIGTQLLKGKNVLINLEGLDSDIAQRVVDFTAGVCYAINGDMKYPSKYFVLAVPNQVELSGIYEGEDSAAQETPFNGMNFDRFQY